MCVYIYMMYTYTGCIGSTLKGILCGVGFANIMLSQKSVWGLHNKEDTVLGVDKAGRQPPLSL